MSIKDTLLSFTSETQIPVAYRAFHEPTPHPFVVYYETASDNFVADNVNYLIKKRYIVELYEGPAKSLQLEAALEAALSGYVWESDETFIDAEQTYLKTYQLED